jgi:hemin uptake protein HemP
MRTDQASVKAEGNQGWNAPLHSPGNRILSQQLLGSKGELVIEHEGREYRLRRTRKGKLILTA